MKTDQLAPLLLSLTPAEKKYFVQFSQLRSDDKSYMKLYDCVLRDGKFNADKLSKELKKTKANLAHEKEYLIENVMKALRNYNDKIPEIQLNNMMSDIAVLREKDLYEFALLKTAKAKKEAARYSRFETQWQLMEQERFLLGKTLPLSKAHVLFDALESSKEEQVENMRCLTAFSKLNLQFEKQYVKAIIATRPDEIAHVNELLAHPLFKIKFKQRYFTFLQHYIQSYLHRQLHQRNDKALVHIRQAFHLIEKEPYFARGDIQFYTGCVASYVNELLANRCVDEFFKFIKRIKNRYYSTLPFNQNYLDAWFRCRLISFLSSYYIYNRAELSATRSDIEKLLIEFEHNAADIKQQLNSGHWVNLQRNIIYLYFFYVHNNDAALRWADRVINQPGSTILNQILSQIKIVKVLIHADLKNYVLLPGLVKSAERHVKKSGLYTALEKETFSFVLRLPKLFSEKERIHAFQKLKERYTVIQNTPSKEQISMGRICYDMWAEKNSK